MNPDLRVSRTQCGLFSSAESRFTPESCRLLLLRSSSLRWEGLESRAEAREVQPSSVIRQPDSLQTHKTTRIIRVVNQHIDKMMTWWWHQMKSQRIIKVITVRPEGSMKVKIHMATHPRVVEICKSGLNCRIDWLTHFLSSGLLNIYSFSNVQYTIIAILPCQRHQQCGSNL